MHQRCPTVPRDELQNDPVAFYDPSIEFFYLGRGRELPVAFCFSVLTLSNPSPSLIIHHISCSATI